MSSRVSTMQVDEALVWGAGRLSTARSVQAGLHVGFSASPQR